MANVNELAARLEELEVKVDACLELLQEAQAAPKRRNAAKQYQTPED